MNFNFKRSHRIISYLVKDKKIYNASNTNIAKTIRLIIGSNLLLFFIRLIIERVVENKRDKINIARTV